LTSWIAGTPYAAVLDTASRSALEPLKPQLIKAGTVLFRPGDTPFGFVLTISGRINVYLNSRTGRELLLYSIDPGQTCVQTTLGMLGSQPYSGEAITESDVVAVVVPPETFDRLLTQSDDFRRFVFKAFADRLGEMTNLLEMVAFREGGAATGAMASGPGRRGRAGEGDACGDRLGDRLGARGHIAPPGGARRPRHRFAGAWCGEDRVAERTAGDHGRRGRLRIFPFQ
jgi:CRP-like cAMP-binding protein